MKLNEQFAMFLEYRQYYSEEEKTKIRKSVIDELHKRQRSRKRRKN